MDTSSAGTELGRHKYRNQEDKSKEITEKTCCMASGKGRTSVWGFNAHKEREGALKQTWAGGGAGEGAAPPPE